MSSSSKRHKGSAKNNGRDRLSELPDSILVHILSFMPILDAVRTVAIRRFGSLWTWLPSLEFHESKSFGDWADGGLDGEQFDLRFANFVRNVLFLHKRVPIESFKLCLINGNDSDDPINEFFVQEFTAWIRFAIDRQVKNLHLDIDMGVEDSILPQCVFTSQFLVVLKLDRVRINELRRVHMRSLTKLSLVNVGVSNEVFNKIVLGSPSLQELYLRCLSGLDELRFTVPNIQKLTLAHYKGLLDCPNLKILDLCYATLTQVVDVSSIREVNMRHYSDDDFKAYMKKFSNVEVFRYLGGRLPYIEQDFSQTRWKSLHIDSTLHANQLLAICEVLRNSPLVEELIVKPGSLLWGTVCDRNVLSLELPSCLMRQLKTVTISGYKTPCHGVLRLAEFLLRSSVALEKLVILPCKYDSSMVNELEFVMQLLSFPRASTNARVIFGSQNCVKAESTGDSDDDSSASV